MLFTLPRETGLGLYSGTSGIGGGAGSDAIPAIVKVVGPDDLGRCCSCFFARYAEGSKLVPMFPDRLGLSAPVTGLGPNLTLGFGSR